MIVGISFPVLATISRGQVEIIIVCLALLSFYFYKKGALLLSSSIIAILGFIKVFPLLLGITFIQSKKRIKLFTYLTICLLILYFLNLLS